MVGALVVGAIVMVTPRVPMLRAAYWSACGSASTRVANVLVTFLPLTNVALIVVV
jgi:hypothetical protein